MCVYAHICVPIFQSGARLNNLRTYVYVYVYVYEYVYVCVSMCIYLCVNACVYVCVHVHVSIAKVSKAADRGHPCGGRRVRPDTSGYWALLQDWTLLPGLCMGTLRVHALSDKR